MRKGTATRERIVERAFRRASRDGLKGVTIGTLATDLGISKSGLFAHFGSKEHLQVAVLRAAADRFTQKVIRPAFARSPRGEPRIRLFFQYWIDWLDDPAMPGGCLFFAAATELDDIEGPPRALLASTMRELHATIAKAARMAVEENHFHPRLDTEQFAFELFGIVLAHHHRRRLLREPSAGSRARVAFERLLADSRTGPIRKTNVRSVSSEGETS
jgi:AcrR family transcriptional regulator